MSCGLGVPSQEEDVLRVTVVVCPGAIAIANARPARLRALVPISNGIVGIELAQKIRCW
jgi:hypothetical protein